MGYVCEEELLFNEEFLSICKTDRNFLVLNDCMKASETFPGISDSLAPTVTFASSFQLVETGSSGQCATNPSLTPSELISRGSLFPLCNVACHL